ncbi:MULTISPECIES: class I SAM-dependent methyltransferase [Ralstonia solanacearum species complex]|uniref:class I SAM-dependent methyltransferase n=1 Tax=Ralstonia solanacearum species complex TaxID=3116862 RepID=UPI000E5830FC|nr:class I SAM-dependent methyltransferase [Ralstonia solanacearum]AXV77396.1 SAM-dependent methyltransferase [Ralstonia solanacearum]AXV91416.1 SAM-dependent methyltransferase [Ralstonia solanacearum]AXW19542.1 SAM-dependent methyltransferase [Ralstonia solanacearum]AXW76321.1 SAM-dependent methyltransferase [Ralstonia solanacearum]
MCPVVPDPHALASPSPWVVRWATPLAAGACVLDIACGGGRHVRWLAARGLRVTGIDRDAGALAGLTDVADTLIADIEHGPWPLPAGAVFDAVVVTNYLHRPLWPHLLACVAPGGRLIYETFAVGNETVGKPSNPAFLLAPGELLEAVRGHLRVIGYEDGFIAAPREAYIQRLCAVREPAGARAPRYAL